MKRHWGLGHLNDRTLTKMDKCSTCAAHKQQQVLHACKGILCAGKVQHKSDVLHISYTHATHVYTAHVYIARFPHT